MNAYLMAAGYAMRLRPITEKYPKCLLTVKGAPMLEHWIQAVIRSGQFKHIFINVHHCADVIENWVSSYSKYVKFPIHIIDERPGLLGTAGTLFWHGDNREDFMVAYTDTYSHDFFDQVTDYATFWKTNPEKALAGLLAFELPMDHSAGGMKMDYYGNITSFEEKNGRGDYAWAGIMFGRRDFMDELRQEDKDLARDVFPRLCGRIRIMGHVDAHDIGRGLDEYEQLNGKVHEARKR